MRKLRLSRRRALEMLIATGVVGGAGAVALLLSRREAKRRMSGPSKDEKLLALVPTASPIWLSRVRELHERLERHDHAGAAESAGYLTDQALTAADLVARAWLELRDEYRGLLPRSLRESDYIWNYKDCAADLYCHLVIEASLIAPAHLASLRDILGKERAISTGLPRAISLSSGDFLGETVDQRIFGAVEYAKDGLLPILERVGPTEWLDRLHEVVEAIIEASPIETRFGRLPSSTTEKNGEFLQVLARLYRREGREDYLVAGRAIADAYVHEVLPGGNGIPAHKWDFFSAHRPRDPKLSLLDHCNEIVAGLAEWTMIEDGAPSSRVKQYRPAIERMMDALLERGRDKAGFWSNYVIPAGSAQPPPGLRLNDTWGYLTSAYVGYALSLPEDSPSRERYLAESRRVFEAAVRYRSAAWEQGMMDGYADTIESAQYLLPYLAIDGATRWIDDEVGILLAYQTPDGFCGRTYLDGNFVRTSLLYALFRTQGARVDPWRPGMRLGAIPSAEGLHLALSSNAPWAGRITFDRIRHREYLNLPYNYPRLNGWTEWFTAKPGVMYEMTLAADGKQPETRLIEGSEMIGGVAVAAPERGGSLHIKVQPEF